MVVTEEGRKRAFPPPFWPVLRFDFVASRWHFSFAVRVRGRTGLSRPHRRWGWWDGQQERETKREWREKVGRGQRRVSLCSGPPRLPEGGKLSGQQLTDTSNREVVSLGPEFVVDFEIEATRSSPAASPSTSPGPDPHSRPKVVAKSCSRGLSAKGAKFWLIQIEGETGSGLQKRRVGPTPSLPRTAPYSDAVSPPPELMATPLLVNRIGTLQRRLALPVHLRMTRFPVGGWSQDHISVFRGTFLDHLDRWDRVLGPSSTIQGRRDPTYQNCLRETFRNAGKVSEGDRA